MVLIQKLGDALEVPTPGALRRGLGRLNYVVRFFHSEEEIWYFAELARGTLAAWPRDVPKDRLVIETTPMVVSFEEDGTDLEALPKLMLHENQFRAAQNGATEPGSADEEINEASQPGTVYAYAELRFADLAHNPEWLDDFNAAGWVLSQTYKHTCVHCDAFIVYNERGGFWFTPSFDRDGRPLLIQTCFHDPRSSGPPGGGLAGAMKHEPARVVLNPPEHVFRNAGAVEAEYPDWMWNLANAVIESRKQSWTQIPTMADLYMVFRERGFPDERENGWVRGYYLTKPGNGAVRFIPDEGYSFIPQSFTTKKRSSDPRAKSRRSKKRVPDAVVDLPPDLFIRWHGSEVGEGAFGYPEGCAANTIGPDVILSCPLLPEMNMAALVAWAETVPVEAHGTSDWIFRMDAGPYFNPVRR